MAIIDLLREGIGTLRDVLLEVFVEFECSIGDLDGCAGTPHILRPRSDYPTQDMLVDLRKVFLISVDKSD